jgi:cbb3-type cytochrome oxidase cytochrome c subunit
MLLLILLLLAVLHAADVGRHVVLVMSGRLVEVQDACSTCHSKCLLLTQCICNERYRALVLVQLVGSARMALIWSVVLG